MQTSSDLTGQAMERIAAILNSTAIRLVHASSHDERAALYKDLAYYTAYMADMQQRMSQHNC